MAGLKVDEADFIIFAGDEEAAAAAEALAEIGLPTRRADSVSEVVGAVAQGEAKALVLAPEGLQPGDLNQLRGALEAQPPWSDLPILLLVGRDEVRRYCLALEGLGQIRLVERPMDAFILQRAAMSAVRSRGRQAKARALLLRLQEAQREHDKLNDSLELRVAERTIALEGAYTRLIEESAERQVAEQRLRQSAELYRYTVELSQQIAWTADANKRILNASPRFALVTGLSGVSDPNEAWLSVIHPDDIAGVLASWNGEGRPGEPRTADFRMRVADGSYRVFRARATPHLDEQGNVVCWYGYTEDVHDQREAELARLEAEERLRESENIYRSTLELSQQIVWTAGPDGRYFSRSQRYNDLTGLSPDASPREAIHPDDIDEMAEAWDKAVASGELFMADFRLRMRDGNYRTFRARAAASRDAAGNIIRWYGTSEDVHEQKQAEQARHEAEERYGLALRATNDVIWDLDLTTNRVQWSQSASAILGYRDDDSTSLNWWEERVHPEDRPRVVTSLDRAIQGAHTHWSASYRFMKPNGGYYNLYDRGFIIRDESGVATRAVGAMSDITDRVHAEAQVQRMQAELIHVSRVSAMGTMASTLAHELNQPLTAVISYVGGSKRLLQGSSDPTIIRVRDALEAAEAGALRAGRIVRGLRELVARGNVSVNAENLHKLVQDACVLAFVDEHLLGISHRLDLDPGVQWVEADRIQIQQVLINLIRNSVQAMADQPVREIVISARAGADDMVEIGVADTGAGLSPEVREALFSPFQSTKSEGMGIGLSISRTIVEAHGGKIWAEDRDGGGTIFCFTVPMSQEPVVDFVEQAAAAE